ncbi:glycoside hydrolase family 16 protein [Flavobacterium rhizosphaerae]|uniref:Glycoside hydrolase family 16 protein n=1 Tax=Flavobacterium rhizosphaerae TaxID=3163298 RepID=A0ABW8YUU8_9FLAO
MKKIALLLLITCFTCTAQVKKGTLVWEENFNGNIIDEATWNFEVGDGCPNCGWGNNERQLYTTENHKVENGNLVITAKKHDGEYTSTRITTANKKEFKYGYIEARVKLPTGQGIWPAFWMLGSDIKKEGWPLSGEIDILEYLGRDPDMVYTTIHTKANHAGNATGKKTEFKNMEEGYHTFGIDWSKQAITFYVDNVSVFTYAPKVKTIENWPFDKPFFIILNMAIGGNFGGPEVDDSIFPQEYYIDYVKVYSAG